MKHRAPLSMSMYIAIGILAFTIETAQAAPVIVPPVVPSNLAPPAGTSAFLLGHARGTQNYVCVPTAAGFSWTLFGPQATLFDDNGNQQITHFLSANPLSPAHHDRPGNIQAIRALRGRPRFNRQPIQTSSRPAPSRGSFFKSSALNMDRRSATS